MIDKNRLPQRVPEGFFEQMEGKILMRAAMEKRRRKTRFIAMASSIAAVAILVAGIFIYMNSQRSTLNNNAVVAQVAPEKYMTDEELDAWITFAENDIFLEDVESIK